MLEVKLKKWSLAGVLSAFFLSACGGGGGSEPTPSPTPTPGPTITEPPVNRIVSAYLRDSDADAQQLSGLVNMVLDDQSESASAQTENLNVYWADDQGERLGEPWLQTSGANKFTVNVPLDSAIPIDAKAIAIYQSNRVGVAEVGALIRFHDFTGNALLSGPGGNYIASWQYGSDRPGIPVQRIAHQGGTCIYDNGLVSVIDMENQITTTPETGEEANDVAYPPYEFLCSEQPFNDYKRIEDENGVWTYSSLNDAMFYGTHVYDTFLKYLGEPPLEDKLRIRVHYGSQSSMYVFWDGAYANFSDGIPFFAGLVSLDFIGHEIAHGVLNRIGHLNAFDYEISQEAKIIHEAFADISGVMMKYALAESDDIWVHGQESFGAVRRLDQINTTRRAIPSYLDYDPNEPNYYLSIGMLTYPFYLLSQEWGLETAYGIYIDAARHCWLADATLPQAAECVRQRAVAAELPEQNVVDAFKAVKIKLFEEGVLSHFELQASGADIQFTDTSVSTTAVTQWQWDFGDGTTSSQANPSHTFDEGRYTVTLTVLDQSGDTDSFSCTLSVQNMTVDDCF